MPIVVESTSSNTASSTALTITKPTGVSVGDLLVAVLTSYDAGAGSNTGTWSTLATWSSAVGALYGGNKNAMSIQYRIATSADVSASSYTFTHTTTENLTGYILRCSGNNVVDGGLVISDEYTNNSASSATYFDSVTPYTPPVDGALVIMQIALYDNSIGTSFISNYTVPNVTFTEVFDNYYGDGTPGGLVASAYGVQSTATEITSNQATITSSWDDHYGQFAVFNPPVDASGTNTLETATAITFNQTGTCDTVGSNVLAEATATMFEQTGRATSPTQWNTKDKPTADWTNPDK